MSKDQAKEKHRLQCENNNMRNRINHFNREYKKQKKEIAI